jgi:hydrogenase maturation protein HypF
LFDAVASIVGLRQRTHFEGQAAMELEFAIGKNVSDDVYSYRIAEPQSTRESSPTLRPTWVVDWTDIVRGILDDVDAAVPVSSISVKFHNTLCEVIVDVAKRIGEYRVLLTGGCFQNKYLTERAIKRLREEGFSPYWHQRVPPNDGGIALGQVYAFLRQTGKGRAQEDSLSETLTLPHNQLEGETIR